MAELSGLLSVYLIATSDELLQKRAVERVKHRLNPDFLDFNFTELSASSDITYEMLRSVLDMWPVGDLFRVVIVYNVDMLTKGVAESLIDYVKDPNESSVLILTSQKIKSNSRLYKAVQRLGPKSIISSEKKKGKHLVDHVIALGRSHNLVLDYSAASELISLVGDSSYTLHTRLKDLSDLAGDNRVITKDFIYAYISKSAESKPWEFLDALFDRNIFGALELFYLLQGSSLGLLSLIEGRTRELIIARCYCSKGMTGQLASRLKKAEWQIKKLIVQSQKFKEKELERLLGACERAEMSIKTGGDEQTQMLLLISGICEGN